MSEKQKTALKNLFIQILYKVHVSLLYVPLSGNDDIIINLNRYEYVLCLIN